MFDTPKGNPLQSLRAGSLPPRTERAAYAALSVHLCPTCLPVHGHTHVVPLLAWAVRTAAAHGILDVVEQTAARAAFLAAVQAAETFLSRPEGQAAAAPQEAQGLLHEPWPPAPCAPLGFSAAHPHGQAAGSRHLSAHPVTLPTQHQTTRERAGVRTLSLARDNGCQFDGRRWTLRFAGHTVTQRNLKGWRYIAFLLQRPGEDVHVLDLLALTDAQPMTPLAGLAGASAAQLAAQGLRVTRGLDARSTIDATARAAYRQRLVDLQDELEEAERNNDPARAAHIRVEMDFLATELVAGYGYRAHGRTAGETTEKARKAVTNRIREALAKLKDTHPALWEHLCRSLKTGTFCSYRPTPAMRWTWQ